MMKADLHIHSNYSDGSDTTTELLENIKKAINKSNDYRAIKIKRVYLYDKKEVKIIFPSDWSNKTIKIWLENNNYPTKNKHFRSYSDYDCTGAIHTIYFELKNQVATIEYLYDC